MKKIIFAIFGIIVPVVGILVFQKKTIDRVSTGQYTCPDCNLIIISMTNLRKKNMSYYGYRRKTTPNIDEFFQDSFYFDRAVAPASLTFTDSFSFFYSLHPYAHKLMNRRDIAISEKALGGHISFPKFLEDRGYKTAAFVSDEDYAFDYGLGKEFGLYFDRSNYQDHNIVFKPWKYNVGTKDLIKPAINWLSENKDSKFFMFLQLYDMHCPYTPSGEFKERYIPPYPSEINFSDCHMTLSPVEITGKGENKTYWLESWYSFLEGYRGDKVPFKQRDIDYLISLYDAELTQADHNLKAFFDTLKKFKLPEKTIIVFMSEHGDYLGESGYFMKAAVTAEGNLHNANLSYPLLLKIPKNKQKRLQQQIIQTIDLYPTLSELLGYAPPAHIQGRSFVSSLGNKRDFNQFAFSGVLRKRGFRDRGLFRIESIQNRDWKLNYYKNEAKKNSKNEVKLFDLKQDPEETQDVSEKHPEKYSEMLSNLIKLRAHYEN